MILGSVPVVDLRVTPTFTTRMGRPVGIVIHHSGVGHGTASDIQIVEAIRRFHVDVRGWADIAYHLMAGEDGVYYIGDLRTQRAHIWRQNHLYWGVLIPGDFTHAKPSRAQIANCALAIQALRAVA